MQSNAIVSCLILIFHSVCCYEDSWVEPNPWSELTPAQFSAPGEDSCQCQAQAPPEKSLATIEDQLALMYFKKFVNSLFSRKRLKYGKSSDLFKRSLLFTLLPSQVAELEAVEDVRDLDIMLSKILDEARDVHVSSDHADDYAYTHREMGVLALVMDIFKDLSQLLHKSEVKFMLFVLMSIAAGCIVHKRYRISVIAIIIGGTFMYGFIYTYLECNRKLEIEAMIEVIDSHQKPTDYSEKGWGSRLYGYFFSESPAAQQKAKLLKSSKLNMPYCRPDHVFIMYMSDILLKQIELLLEKATHSISSLSAELSFPFSLIAPFALVCMVGYFLKLIFKYVISPKAWMGLGHRRHSPIAPNMQQQAVANEPVADRLSGENLKILLNVIGTSQQQKQPQLQLPVSGVQELLEPLEALPQPPQPESKQNSEPLSYENPNISNSSTDIAQAAGFTVVDDNEDVDQIDNV